jgi:hypothetical protein
MRSKPVIIPPLGLIPRLGELLSPDYCRLVPHAAAKTPTFLAACKVPCLRLLDTLLCDLSRVREILRRGPSVIGSGSDCTLSVSVTVPFSHSVASHTSGAIEVPRQLSPLVAEKITSTECPSSRQMQRRPAGRTATWQVSQRCDSTANNVVLGQGPKGG